jgi:ABC-type antimicrobial peptide transport system permease subunit
LQRFLGAVAGLAFGVILGWTAVQLMVRFWPWEIEVDLGTVFLVFVLVVSASTIAGAWWAGRHRRT